MTANQTNPDELFDHSRETNSTFLTETELAKRWRISKKKLQADRLLKRGPAFIKVGRLIRYKLSNILEYEALKRRASTCEGGDQ